MSRVASADEATSSARFTPGQTCGPWLKWLNPQSSAASPSIHSSGAKRSAYSSALAVAVVERVDDQDLRPAGTTAPRQLSSTSVSRESSGVVGHSRIASLMQARR